MAEGSSSMSRTACRVPGLEMKPDARSWSVICALTAASPAAERLLIFTQPVASASKAGLRGWLPCTSASWLPKMPYQGTPSPTALKGSFICSNRPGKSRTELSRWASAEFSARSGE